MEARISVAILFGGAGGTVLSILLWRFARRERRREHWQELGVRLGLEYSAEDPYELPSHTGFRLLPGGHKRRIRNLLEGEYRGWPVRCFDYEYEEDDAISPFPQGFTVVRVQARQTFPSLEIRPQGLLGGAAESLGIGDLDFESEEFSRRYYVASSDHRAAYDILHPRSIELLLSAEPVWIEARGNALLFRRVGRGLLDVGEGVPKLLDLAVDFVEMTPEQLGTSTAKGAGHASG